MYVREQCVVMQSYDDLLADMWVSEVQVWLFFKELVQVALSSQVIISP